MGRWVSTPSYKDVGEVIAVARREAGFTQRALAERLGRPNSVVASIEMGDRRVDVVELTLIARAIGIDEVELFKRIRDVLGPGTSL